MTPNYTFTHEFTSNYNTPGMSILYKTEADSTNELVNDFYHFLLGCGFQQSSIINALREVAEEIGGDS